MPAVRAFAALLLAGFMGTWLTQAPTTAPHPKHQIVRMPATTSTVVTTTSTSTTTTTQAPRLARASRGGHRSRPELDEDTKARVIAAICSYTDWDCGLMVRVAGCESGLSPYAVNGKHHGIFQIAGSTLGLIEEHVALAHSMWTRKGMRDWTASRSCWS